MNFKIFIIFCVIFVLKNNFVDGSASCLYENHKRLGYTCRLSVNSDQPEQTFEISGSHLPSKTDDDVVAIQKHKIPKLQVLPAALCDKFKNIEKFNIPTSKIQKIEENEFKNCKNLQKVILDENEIEELPENLFDENTKLEHVSIMFNKLTTAPENLFKNNSNLKSLSLMGNKINFLPENIFKNLKNLTSILLGMNRISDVNPSWFMDLQNLQLLFLSQNLISELPKNTFAPLKNINRLNLAANNISVLDSESFGVHNELQFFNIENNKINAVDENFFQSLSPNNQFDMTGNVCFAGRLKIYDGNLEELNTKMARCFENFKELKQNENEATTIQQQSQTTTDQPNNEATTDVSLSKSDEILKILAELRDEIKTLRNENRELKAQQDEILKLIKKM